MRPSLFAQLKTGFERLLHTGIIESTPSYLIDRIVFCNWSLIIGTVVNLIGALINFQNGYLLLFFFNCFYQVCIIICWRLLLWHQYLTARLYILSSMYAGMFVVCAVQGPVVQMEYFLLPLAAFAFNMFHPVERKWSWIFGFLTLFGFLFFTSQTGPLIEVDPAFGRYTKTDLHSNQLMYVTLLILLLKSLSDSYARAVRIADEQRHKIFEQTRLVSVGAMANNIAYEMNSPLTALDTNVNKLMTELHKNSASAESKIYLPIAEKIKQLSNRVVAIVRGFKLISSTTIVEGWEYVSLQSLINPSVELTEDRVNRLGVQLQIQLHYSEEKILCQPLAISQVILNLMNNAVDAVANLSPGNRWIKITSVMKDETCVVCIQDSGTLDMNLQKKVFEPFYTTKPLGRGIGLGLPISRRIVHQHKGHLELDPHSIHTTFVLTLPLNGP